MSPTNRGAFTGWPGSQYASPEAVMISVDRTYLFAVLLTLPLALFSGLFFVEL